MTERSLAISNHPWRLATQHYFITIIVQAKLFS